MSDSHEVALVRMEGKIDTLIATVNGRVALVERELEITAAEARDHETRILTLEKWQARVVGGAIALGALAGGAAAQLVHAIRV